MTSQAKTRVAIGAALVVALAALGWVAFGDLGKNLVYYWTPAELLAQGDKAYGATVRLGGVVEPGSVKWDEQSLALEFRIAENNAPGAKSVLVHSTGAPPQMFREKIGVIVEGSYDSGQVFKSDRVMVNHSNEYRPPEPGQAAAGFGAGSLLEAQQGAAPAGKK